MKKHRRMGQGILIGAVLGAVLLGTALFWSVRHSRASGQAKAVYYFYDEVCGSCDHEGEFRQLLLDRLAGVALPEDLHIYGYNLFSGEDGLWIKLCDALDIPEQERTTPMVIAGDAYVTGQEEIDSHLRHLVCELCDIPDTGTVWYYYRPDCEDCNRIEDLVEESFRANPQLSLIRIDTNDPSEKEKFKEKLRGRKVPEDEWQVPFLDNGRDYLSGDTAIEASISDFLQQK